MYFFRQIKQNTQGRMHHVRFHMTSSEPKQTGPRMCHTLPSAQDDEPTRKLRNSECRHENRGNTITYNYCACSRQNTNINEPNIKCNSILCRTWPIYSGRHLPPMLTTVPSFHRIQCTTPLVLFFWSYLWCKIFYVQRCNAPNVTFGPSTPKRLHVGLSGCSLCLMCWLLALTAGAQEHHRLVQILALYA